MSLNKVPLTIGKLAKSAHVNIETVRHYQRKGLIEEPEKPLLGYRIYPAETISRLSFIKRAQKLGFSLKEILQLLTLGEQHCDQVKQLATDKRKLIHRQIKQLLIIEGVLDELIDSCEVNNQSSNCAFIDALSKTDFFKNS